MSWRMLQRIGAVLALLLAALLLGADAGEYPGLSRAGIRALARGILPLLLVAGFNLAALDGRKAVRVLALVLNIAFLIAVARMLGSGAPPFVWMALAVATVLVISSGRSVMR